MELSEEQKLSLEIDEFVKEANVKLLEFSKRADEFRIALDLGAVHYSCGPQIKIAKEYLVGDDDA